MSAPTTPQERADLRVRARWELATSERHDATTLQRAQALLRVLDEYDALEKKLAAIHDDMEADLGAIEKVIREGAALSRPIDLRTVPIVIAAQELRAEVERLRKTAKGPIVRVRYAISHAKKGVRGGPWEANTGNNGTPTARMCESWSTHDLPLARIIEGDIARKVPSAHVVRFVTRKKASR